MQVRVLPSAPFLTCSDAPRGDLSGRSTTEVLQRLLQRQAVAGLPSQSRSGYCPHYTNPRHPADAPRPGSHPGPASDSFLQSMHGAPMSAFLSPPPPDLLLTCTQAAAVLSLSRATVQRLVASGELPSVTVGRARQIPVSDLQAYVASLPRTGWRSSHGPVDS